MAKEYGFEGIEIWGARPHAYAYDMDKQSIEDIKRWKKLYDIEISMFTPEILAYPYSLTSRLDNERKETLDYLIRSVETAASIGTEKMQITAPHPGYGVNRRVVWKRLVDGLIKLCKRAEELGVDIIVEPLSPSEGGNIITTADDLLDLFEDVGSPALNGMIDAVPPVIANEPFSEYFDKLGEKMAYIHICNSDGATEFHMQLDDPKGVIPILDMFKVFQRYNYKGWCSLELLAPYFKDPELYLAQAARVINEICGYLGISRE
ncbi:MAG: TIM barrel protein [Tissierellaceae bacterium]|nr:TIM barrel protein [Tissierellaceae bacterium]